MSLSGPWERFWFRLASPASLGLFRMLFGACVLFEIPTTQARSTFAIEGGFHLPYVSWLHPVGERAYEMLHMVQYPLASFLVLGILARPAAVALLLVQSRIFFADELTFRNHPYFFLLVLLVLAASPCDESFALGAFLRRRRAGRPLDECLLGDAPKAVAFARLVALEVSLVYLLAAIHKIHDHYLDGSVLQHVIGKALHEKDFGRWIAELAGRERFEWMLQRPEPFVVLAAFTVVAEIILAFALWWPRTRRVGIGLGLALHLGIAVTMEIRTFTGAMLASYLLFLDPETLPSLTRRALARLRGR